MKKTQIRRTYSLDELTAAIIEKAKAKPGIDGNDSAAVRMIVKEWADLTSLPTPTILSDTGYNGHGLA